MKDLGYDPEKEPETPPEIPPNVPLPDDWEPEREVIYDPPEPRDPSEIPGQTDDDPYVPDTCPEEIIEIEE